MLDSKGAEIAQLHSPVTIHNFQKLQLPITVDGKTVMAEITLDLTNL